MPESVDRIDTRAFGLCTELKNVIIPDSVVIIDTFAFCNTGITKLHIPKSVKWIGMNPWEGCCQLSEISVASENERYVSIQNCVIDTYNNKNELVCGCKNSVIEDDSNILRIGIAAFWGCDDLTKITIPESVIEIGLGSFRKCKKLEEVYFNNPHGWKEHGKLFGNISSKELMDPQNAAKEIKKRMEKNDPGYWTRK